MNTLQFLTMRTYQSKGLRRLSADTNRAVFGISGILREREALQRVLFTTKSQLP